MSDLRIGSAPMAVVDLETTGIYAEGHERIVEVGIVRLNAAGEVEDEYATLVNAQRDVGRSDIHGIRAGDLLHAPVFEEIAGDVGARLEGAILVGHNLRFDVAFLRAEYGRLGVEMPPLPGLCTLHLAYKLLPEAPSRNLATCCYQLGVRHENEHVAIADARATAAIARLFLDMAREQGMTRLEDLGCKYTSLPLAPWVPFQPSGRAVPREAAAQRTREERSYLARLVESMLADDAPDANSAEYMSLLDRALEDRRVTAAEAEALVRAAGQLGLSRADVQVAHRTYLAGLVAEAMSDSVITPTERADLELVTELLGLSTAALEALLAGPPPTVVPRAGGPQASELVGKSVCFTGEITALYQGERITRVMAEGLAVQAGLQVLPRVTKKLDILVVADPDTMSLKAQAAIRNGTRIMAQAAFWKAIGVAVV